MRKKAKRREVVPTREQILETRRLTQILLGYIDPKSPDFDKDLFSYLQEIGCPLVTETKH